MKKHSIREKSLLWRLEQFVVVTVLSAGLLAISLPCLWCFQAIKEACVSLL